MHRCVSSETAQVNIIRWRTFVTVQMANMNTGNGTWRLGRNMETGKEHGVWKRNMETGNGTWSPETEQVNITKWRTNVVNIQWNLAIKVTHGTGQR